MPALRNIASNDSGLITAVLLYSSILGCSTTSNPNPKLSDSDQHQILSFRNNRVIVTVQSNSFVQMY